jgi:antitoxin (DNA-binding transcriptional repressor) of toxin-antitoxin stability system
MEVTITQFRRDLFRLIDQTIQGEPLYVTYRNQRFRIVPEALQARNLEALTSLQVVNPNAPDVEDPDWKEEMVREWEEDWSQL